MEGETRNKKEEDDKKEEQNNTKEKKKVHPVTTATIIQQQRDRLGLGASDEESSGEMTPRGTQYIQEPCKSHAHLLT